MKKVLGGAFMYAKIKKNFVGSKFERERENQEF